MRSVLMNIVKSGTVFAINENQSVFEIKIREIGDESHLFFILLNELLEIFEFVNLHLGGPNCVD